MHCLNCLGSGHHWVAWKVRQTPRSVGGRRPRCETCEKPGHFGGGDKSIARAMDAKPTPKWTCLSRVAAEAFCRPRSSYGRHCQSRQRMDVPLRWVEDRSGDATRAGEATMNQTHIRGLVTSISSIR